MCKQVKLGRHKHKQKNKKNEQLRSSCACACAYVVALRWLNTVLRTVSDSSRDGACFILDKQTWRRKKQWYTEDYFSKSAH